MNWKNWLSTLGSAFVGGSTTFLAANITAGIPTTAQGVETFAAGAAVAGLVAIAHLYMPTPPKPSTVESPK